RRRMSVLDRLSLTHPAWLLLTVSAEEATRILLQQPPGVFLVRKEAVVQKKVLSVRVEKVQSENAISHFPVRESQYTFSLEGSEISFADLFRLVAFYCISRFRDVLPFTLKLPEAIASATTQKELEEVAQLGTGGSDSSFSSCALGLNKQTWISLYGTNHPGNQRRLTHFICESVFSLFFPCSSSVKQCVSHPTTRRWGEGSVGTEAWGRAHCAAASSRINSGRKTLVVTILPKILELGFVQPGALPPPPPEPNPQPPEKPQGGSGLAAQMRQGSQRQRTSNATFRLLRIVFSFGEETLQRSCAPPPHHLYLRPPLPDPRACRKPPCRRTLKSSKRRPAPQPRKGARPSGASKVSTSPVATPSNLPPPTPKNLDLEAHRCHIAMEDDTIAEALSRAKLPSCRPPPADEGEHTDPLSVPTRGRQRLSDTSVSSSSSDSLDYSPSPGFSFGLTSSRSQHLNHQVAVEDSSEDDENDDEDEEVDYGVGLETDLEMRLRQSSKAQRKRISVSLGGGPFILPRALKGRFQKVSGMLSSLVTPERRIIKKITELSHDRSSYFGSLVQDYISFVQENRGCHTSGTDFLQTLRQFMTQMKAYLCQSSELDPPLESLIPEDQIDQVLEKAMHKSVLKPLKSVIEKTLHDFQVNSGAWQQLKNNLALAKTKRPQELGVDGAVLPDAVALDKIRQKFLSMRKKYSPEKKVSVLLRVCKLIYSVMQDNSGRMYGADDFLPMLTYVVAQCDVPQLDMEVEYMMELLDPSLLQGEGGYYLTSAYGAMALIKNIQEEQAARVLSSEARNTLHQWHRRRTAQRSAPSVNDFQNYLNVALQVDSGCTAKTLLVSPYTTTEEVCSLCAQKLKIQKPEQYALFLVTEEMRQQLAPDTHPQRIKAELHSRPRTNTFHFLYR
uniref:Ras and Rab interactor 2 n=1 Tax=Tetraodon nigroviridis TaxID=99883 RepID=H3D9H6_TETNG